MASLFIWALVFFAGAICASAEESLGTKSTIEDHPSLVQVETRVLLTWTQICAASVLTSWHVLSIAKCFSGPLYIPINRRIRAGSSVRGSGGIIYQVAREYNHPNFGLLGDDSDISVVRLQTQLSFGENVAQASILGQGIELPDGMKVTIAGWGNTMQGAESADNDLYELELYTSNNDNCMEKYLESPEPSIVTENMVCSGLLGTGRNFDGRDYGAPLFYENVVVALASFGVDDSADSHPMVSTAVGSFTSWIVETATYVD